MKDGDLGLILGKSSEFYFLRGGQTRSVVLQPGGIVDMFT